MDAAQVGPVQFTMGPVPSYPRLDSALQIFSVKVVELKGTMMCWPIDVYGFIAVRDSVDRNRNYIFERARSNYQTLNEQVPVPPYFNGFLTTISAWGSLFSVFA
jgi:hypothetical protein